MRDQSHGSSVRGGRIGPTYSELSIRGIPAWQILELLPTPEQFDLIERWDEERVGRLRYSEEFAIALVFSNREMAAVVQTRIYPSRG